MYTICVLYVHKALTEHIEICKLDIGFNFFKESLGEHIAQSAYSRMLALSFLRLRLNNQHLAGCFVFQKPIIEIIRIGNEKSYTKNTL